MSYKDLRNLTEMTRALGYPRLISMENFKISNFALVAEILAWLVKRYDPNSDLPADIDMEQDRVIFIKSVVQFLSANAHIKMNAKKLYQADGYAVKELLKITRILYNAVKNNAIKDQNEEDDIPVDINFDISSKLHELKNARKLATEITMKGASLYDLLAKEVHLREVRTNVIGRQLEINEVEKSLNIYLKCLEKDIKKTQASIDNVASDEANLEAKIEKKKGELERNEKRLNTLESVRPAYMDEYESLEKSLHGLYDEYMKRFLNQAYLESVLADYNRQQQALTEGMENGMRKLAEQIQAEEQELDMGQCSAAGVAGVNSARRSDNSEDEQFDIGDDDMGDNNGRPQHSRHRGVSGMNASHTKVMGNMGMNLEDDSGDESDSDLDLEPDSDDLDLSEDEGEMMLHGHSKTISGISGNNLGDSDNDF